MSWALPAVCCKSSQALQEEAGSVSLTSPVPAGFVLLQGLPVSGNSLGMAAVCMCIFHLCKLNMKWLLCLFFFVKMSCEDMILKYNLFSGCPDSCPCVELKTHTHTHISISIFLYAVTIYSETCKLYLHFLAESPESLPGSELR